MKYRRGVMIGNVDDDVEFSLLSSQLPTLDVDRCKAMHGMM
jgi:hypothetical protein